MRTIVVALAVVGSALPISAGVPVDEKDEESIRLLQKLIPPGTIVDQRSFDANGFNITTHKAHELDREFKLTDELYAVATLHAGDRPYIAVVIDRNSSHSLGFTAYHPISDEPMLSAGDSDGDGRIDSLSYAVLDAEGHAVLEVYDYEMDGQPDMRVRFDQHSWELWYRGQWLAVEKNGETRGVTIDGQFRPIVKRGGRAYVE